MESVPASAHASRVIGIKADTAYLLVWHGSPRILGGGSHVYSIPVKDLKDAEIEAIRAGTNPWAN
jgi:hypothetical protein